MNKVLTLEEANKIIERSGGHLYLSNTQIEELPNNLVVPGYLYLRNTSIKKSPNNIVVGKELYLDNVEIEEPPNNLKVGQYVCSDIPLKYDRLKNGDYEPNRYIYVDNILTHIKGTKIIGKYTYYIGVIKGRNVITDGEYFAHCRNVREGIQDLAFKRAEDRGIEQYNSLTLDSVLSLEEMMTMYRIITGACRQGTEAFVKGQRNLKDKYTVREAIEITKGQYNSRTFEQYFCNAN